MKLTPLEIKKQEFRKALRGYDPIEVQTFLEMVAEEYEKNLEENKSLSRRLIELETKLQDYQETEKTLQETLVNVQEVKKQSEESSKRQADLIVKEAELKALEIMENARKQARQMRDEVSWLKSQKESFINRLRHILISQIELLSVMEIDDAIPEEAKKILKNVKSRKINEISESQKMNRDAESGKKGEEGDEKTVKKSTGILLEEESDKAPAEDGKPSAGLKTAPEKTSDNLADEDVNEFLKKGIQIDDLIKTLNKKGKSE